MKYTIYSTAIILLLSACSSNENIKKNDDSIYIDHTDTIYSENAVIIFDKGRLVEVDFLDEYYNIFQVVQFNSLNASIEIKNVAEDYFEKRITYDWIRLNEGSEKQLLFNNFLLDNLSVQVDNENNFQWKFDFNFLYSSLNKKNLYVIYVINDDEIIHAESFFEKLGSIDFSTKKTKQITVLFQNNVFGLDENDTQQIYTYSILRSYSLHIKEGKPIVSRLLPFELSKDLDAQINERSNRFLGLNAPESQ